MTEVSKLFVGKIMKKGKRSRAERVYLESIENLRKVEKDFAQALNNIVPLVQVKSKKVGGTFYRIPVAIGEKRAKSLGISWLLESVSVKQQGKLADRVTEQLLMAGKGQGKVVERVKELHELAKKNRGLVKFL
jgi:small subunit ribosomal protein S7